MSELTPYLAVRDARSALDWYVEHLGARVTYEPIVMPDGRIGHTELTFGRARWMMSDEYPEIQVEAPAPGRGAAVTLHLTVDDVDGLVHRVVAGGAVLDRGPEDNPAAGRVAVFRDPFGHRWFLSAPVSPASPEADDLPVDETRA
ncbi:MAG: VOC family protein [Nocardioidaceae bacterium]